MTKARMTPVEDIPVSERPKALAAFRDLAARAREAAAELQQQAAQDRATAANFDNRADESLRAAVSKLGSASHWEHLIERLEALS